MAKVHQMILLDADLRTVHARLAKKFNDAPLVQSAEQDTRNVQTSVRFRDGAPDNNEPEAA